jgi:BirA family biotin operon repressor/biotin-[acetyl-CoA-carboxylase] ligase
MKNEILRILRENKPGNVSGEELSKILGVTRTAIWKHIRQLTSDGYVINASSRNGYSYVSAPGGLNSFEIKYGLDTSVIGKDVIYLDSVDSTNDHAKKLADEGADDGTVVIAGRQTKGRGRLGRSWESEEGCGIYLSVILKPDAQPRNMQLITVAAAAAAVSAIERSTGLKTLIKWPNDIVIDGRKVCGILTEMNTELDRVNYIILGIGINYSHAPENFSSELSDKAVSLLTCASERGLALPENGRLMLVRDLLEELDKIYIEVAEGRGGQILHSWKKNTATLGKEVRVVYRGTQYEGTAIDITGDAGLVVRLQDGSTMEITSGEVSVRGLLGYC